MVAGLVVGLSGQAVFSDWPSWVNGHIGVALLPWAWWLTRRAMAGRNPAGALAVGYLVVSIGYVYCVLYLATVLLGCFVDALLSRSRRQLLTVLGISVFSGLVAVTVYLPGVLTSPVTHRGSLEVTGPGLFSDPSPRAPGLDAADGPSRLPPLAAARRRCGWTSVGCAGTTRTSSEPRSP